MKYEKLSRDEQISHLIKYIIEVLQGAGGQLDRSEIRNRISEIDDDIAEFEQKMYISKKTGNMYKKFDFAFNIAMKELLYVGFIFYIKYKPQTTLTAIGAKVNLSNFDPKLEVRDKASVYWEEFASKRKNDYNNQEIAKNNFNKKEITEEEETAAEEHQDVLGLKLQDAIAKMSPSRFEKFSRALLTKMGVEFSDKEGIQISNDGGIDGLGYHKDDKDFRTTRVVIQCKRFNKNPVTEPDINQFLGAMNKFKADYGVFITNSRFTNAARKASREGTPITLIDGNELIKLIIKYELFLDQITTYELQDFYFED
ncbi:restriction endonuclease [Mycoplasmopsis canis PG 14]|uniref:EcoKMrr n=1 Tax=Mycoplasmopsis canis TaxID=29555 RepID=A0A449AR28_9BACT|nr:restriction endonuclease [Mycoplasmopsis canis]AMD81140.1 restriction endonuclease [Mycoplasmopsis canis PG 14]VEU68961.1 EcoKMrr [Mycoplasmopsis canis]